MEKMGICELRAVGRNRDGALEGFDAAYTLFQM